MPITGQTPSPRAFRFAHCPSSTTRVACVTTRDVTPDPNRHPLPDTTFLEANGIAADEIAWVDQVHGRRILASTRPGAQGRADAMMTDRDGIVLMIRVADCLPVFIVDEKRGLVALAHAGWRGVVGGIVPDTIGALETLYGSEPSDLWVGIGPGIGPCCFEVGEEVAERFAEAHVTRDGRRPRCDLPGALTDDVLAAGVLRKNVEPSGLCTMCQEDLFPSYRQDKTDERLFALLSLG